MSEAVERIKRFVAYAKTLDGKERAEAQVYCDRLFQAFGHDGYKEAGATLEYSIRRRFSRAPRFADLVWKPRLLLEMKKAGTRLHLHYDQALDYWLNAVPNRPRYVVLCNFNEFWIYDFDRQLDTPVDTLSLDDLPLRYTALNFLFPDERKPQFGNDREYVSRETADKMAELFRNLVQRDRDAVPRGQAQRFVLQTVVAMFAEDIDLLPAGTVSTLVGECLDRGQSAYDLFAGLFRQMNTDKPAKGGWYRGVGGQEGAATQNWSKVNPAIFGTLFQHSLDAAARHALGAHFTSEADIQRIVEPTIVRPWRERIDAAARAEKESTERLFALRRELMRFRVLDPACGSGNFLYVAFREMARLDLRILTHLKENMPKEFVERARPFSIISPKQFYGIEIDLFGAELAKVTLMIAKKLAIDEAQSTLGLTQTEMSLGGSDALPLDNLDDNILCADALLTDWPEVEAIIGNPPYQSKNKAQGEMDLANLREVREAFPDVDGRSDYCVYWFRKAHDHLKAGQRAGLVGTNTIRQNYTREAGLDFITDNGGTITEAVSSMIWPGEAVVHVSIVNWIKGDQKGPKRLYNQDGNDVTTGWRHEDFDAIGSSLSFALDVTKARRIEANAKKGGCFQGQTHGHPGFLIDATKARELIKSHKGFDKVLHPFLVADELIGDEQPQPSRYVIDFQGKDVIDAEGYGVLFTQVKKLVLPDRKKAADEESERNKPILEKDPDAKVNKHHANFLKRWWQLSYAREDMIEALNALDRYIVCGRVTKRPIFEFVSRDVHPNDALQVFPYDDDYSFGILQSGIHWAWFVERCSTLKSDYRYTSNTVFDTFPWPQSPSAQAIQRVAQAAVKVRKKRSELRVKTGRSFRELYRTLETPGDNPLRDVHEELDTAVRGAYGMTKSVDPLAFLLSLNFEVAEREAEGGDVQGPGLPSTAKNPEKLVTDDSLTVPPQM
ncbi:MAG: class I SAM-dependent DNA methyltransferase [Rhizobiales bacterium]|nr:class I SAM-dependent DNA methyltransferase [Hyphomicrobiales bacterium]